MDHDRNVELGRLGKDRKRKVAVVRRPMVIHRVELQPGQAKLRDGALQLRRGRLDASEARVHRRHADERLRVLRDQSGDVVVALVDARRTLDPRHAGDVDGAA